MRPILGLFDNFFPAADQVFDDISLGDFTDYMSPWDGVIYPKINSSIPSYIAAFVDKRLREIMDREIVITAMFARLTTEGVEAPHKIHSDQIMGQYSMHVYLSHNWPAGGGTSFWSHITEGNMHTSKTDLKVIERDYNNPAMWKLNFSFQARFNRAAIHDACLWHAAEPEGGFGNNARTGRLVLTTFFSEVT